MDVEYMEDRIRVHYHLQMPYGVPDMDCVREVFYAAVDKLPRLQEEGVSNYGIARNPVNYREVDVNLPGERTVTFVFTCHPELSHGPEEESIHGPFLKK